MVWKVIVYVGISGIELYCNMGYYQGLNKIIKVLIL